MPAKVRDAGTGQSASPRRVVGILDGVALVREHVHRMTLLFAEQDLDRPLTEWNAAIATGLVFGRIHPCGAAVDRRGANGPMRR